MISADFLLRTTSGSRSVSLATYLAPEVEEAAHEAAYGWIKGLRHLPVDGVPFRDRFTVRGDSLWWFTEIYLHREQVILHIHRALSALDALIAAERPLSIEVTSASPVVRFLVPLVGAARGVSAGGPVSAAAWWRRLTRLDLRARHLNLAALLTADRFRRAPSTDERTELAAFIHRAFWRAGGEDGAAESYIGPVLEQLEHRLGAAAVRYVGVGPVTNFRSRRQWTPQAAAGHTLVPVERYAPLGALRASRSMWRERGKHFKILRLSPALRSAAVINGIDCWPLVREQLAGTAWLQWPWSVRAMDEAAAALESIAPTGVLTYAEAGGWGRALILESRRRGIPSAGLQHGFIYRHWLNYRHEPDELQSSSTAAFPLPTATLLFDRHAQRQLEERGQFPPATLRVTGSPRLDELRDAVEQLRREDPSGLRRALGVNDTDAVVLVATKEKEARAVLAWFTEAAARLPDVLIVIKPHPAESAEAYAGLVRLGAAVKISPASMSLAQLLAISRVVVTVNSTVALDAGSLDIPALVLGLPNNLSPFVDAGALVGCGSPAEVPGLLSRILYDEKFRQQLGERRRAVVGDPSADRSGRASAAAADAVLTLIHSRSRQAAGSGL